MFSRFKSLFIMLSLILTGALATVAQQPTPTSIPTSTPQQNKNQEKPKKPDQKTPQLTGMSKNITAEQIAESTIFVYGGYGGRETLKQIRRTTIESGRLSIANENGTNEQINYERRILRGDSLEKEKVRLDQDFPDAKYALIYSDNKVIGLYNDSSFTPREDASKAFQNQIWHGLEALLRYKENASTLKLIGQQKLLGVDLNVIEVTDKEGRKTIFYTSAKTFRVLSLEYTEDGIKYTRRFYDYRYAQGTLVPYRTVLSANGKQIEEASVLTSTFGQRLDDEIFKSN